MNIEIPLNRAASTAFLEALKATSRAKGLDIRYSYPLAVAIRAAKDAAQDFQSSAESVRDKHGGEVQGQFINFQKPLPPDATDEQKAAAIKDGNLALKAFNADMKALGERMASFEMPSLIPMPEGLTGDHAEEVLEFLKAPESIAAK